MLGCRVDGHVVVLDGHIVLLLLEIDVAHVNAKTRCLRVLLVFEDDCVAVDRFRVQAVGVVHVCQIVEDIEGQVDVHLVEAAVLLAERSDLLLLSCRLFCLLESLVVVLGDLGRG